MKKDASIEFTSRMSRGETAAALIYLPIHILLLPLIVVFLLGARMDEIGLNLVVYAVGAVYMLIFERKFLRREFDTLRSNVLDSFVQILVCFGIMFGLNILIGVILLAFGLDSNPNNNAIIDFAGAKLGMTSAMAVFLAPIVEELIFRGGIFGLLRRCNRLLAYAVTILLFSVYHIWGSAMDDPAYLIYTVQYFGASYALCRCYERTNSIWAGIFLHMLYNGWAIKMLDFLGA